MNGSDSRLASSGSSTAELATSEPPASSAEPSWLARAGASEAARALTPRSPPAADPDLGPLRAEDFPAPESDCGAEAGADWRGAAGAPAAGAGAAGGGAGAGTAAGGFGAGACTGSAGGAGAGAMLSAVSVTPPTTCPTPGTWPAATTGRARRTAAPAVIDTTPVRERKACIEAPS